MCSQRTRSADIGFSGGSARSAFARQQRGDHVVGVGGLGEIVDRAELHGVHRGGDVAVAGEDDGARVGPALLERRDDVEAVAVAEPHVDHREGRRAASRPAAGRRRRTRRSSPRSRGFPWRAPAAAGTACRPRRSAASARRGGNSAERSLRLLLGSWNHPPGFPASCQGPHHTSREIPLQVAPNWRPLRNRCAPSAPIDHGAAVGKAAVGEIETWRRSAPAASWR
jgi:hypothetical protein